MHHQSENSTSSKCLTVGLRPLAVFLQRADFSVLHPTDIILKETCLLSEEDEGRTGYFKSPYNEQTIDDSFVYE